ncbi:MAG TPA: sterol desaturase family protein [Flavobacteriaceae bacterium]|nr:sterol desaturase family protein [Flavobacteriaceae bacterium]
MKALVIQPLFWAAPLLISLLVAEFIYSKVKGHKHIYNLKDFIASSLMGFGAMILNPLVKLFISALLFYVAYELFNPIVNGVRTNILGYASFSWAWYVWIICQILDDLSHYWLHRFNHTVRFMWAAHIVHHSSEHYNYGTALRLSWTAMIYKPLFYVWLPVIGFHPEMVVVCLGVESVWQFLLHTSYCPKLKFLEFFLITPKQHQVHHATNVEYLDKNHGAILNIWDRIFGTWKDYDHKININYGVVHSPNSYNPFVIATHEYKSIWKDVKSAKNFHDAFMYVFGPPGWSPTGETLTVKQLQKTLVK